MRLSFRVHIENMCAGPSVIHTTIHNPRSSPLYITTFGGANILKNADGALIDGENTKSRSPVFAISSHQANNCQSSKIDGRYILQPFESRSSGGGFKDDLDPVDTGFGV